MSSAGLESDCALASWEKSSTWQESLTRFRLAAPWFRKPGRLEVLADGRRTDGAKLRSDNQSDNDAGTDSLTANAGGTRLGLVLWSRRIGKFEHSR